MFLEQWTPSCECAVYLGLEAKTTLIKECVVFVFQGKGLFAKKSIKKGETIFIERPLVSAQFLWNALYKYKGETPSNDANTS